MKLLCMVLLTGCCSATPIMPDEENYNLGYPGYPEGLDISRAELLDYLANLRLREEMEIQHPLPMDQLSPVVGAKPKRRWSRWGNKYADNKSYGFWITALNKAGNYKRGKRAEPFVPGLSAQQPPVNFMHTLTGEKKEPKELVVDHDYSTQN